MFEQIAFRRRPSVPKKAEAGSSSVFYTADAQGAMRTSRRSTRSINSYSTTRSMMMTLHGTQSLSHLGRRPATGPRLLRWAVLPVLCLFFAPQAFGDLGPEASIDFPIIRVVSNGEEYFNVKGIAFQWDGGVNIHPNGFGQLLARIKSWSLYPTLSMDGLDEQLSFWPYRLAKSYRFGKRPKSVHWQGGVIFPNVFVRDFAVAACNLRLDQLMAGGLSRAQVLHQDRTAAVILTPQTNVDVTVIEPIHEAVTLSEVDIICEKSPFNPPAPGAGGGLSTTGDLKLVEANLIILKVGSFSGECPMELTLYMNVKGSHSGPFEAHVESTAGWKSTSWNLETEQFFQSSGLFGHEWSQPLTFPIEMISPGGAGGGGSIEPVAGNFLPQTLPGYDPFAGQDGAGAGNVDVSLLPKDPGSNVHQGSLRVKAWANGKTVYSPWKPYKVTCDPKIVVGTTATGFLPGGTGGGTKPDPGPNPTPMPNQPPGRPAPSQPQPSASAVEPGKDAASLNKPASRPKRKAGNNAAKPSDEAKKTPAAASSSANKAPSSSKAKGKPSPKAKPSPKPKPDAHPRRRAVRERPDLEVKGARRSPKFPHRLELLFLNSGQAKAPPSTASLTCPRSGGGAEAYPISVPQIEAGGRKWVPANPPARPRKVRAQIRVCLVEADPNDTIDEEDEGNNRYRCNECKPARKVRRP